MKKIIAASALFVTLLVSSFSLFAQCSMCTINAEQGAKNGNTQTKGINTGVLYLLAIPYLLVGGVGGLWYVNYRKKNNGEA
jgi:hypothetical protein